MSTLFEYHKLADRLAIRAERLRELETLVQQQYAGDEMMVELRLLRTLRAIEDGAVSLADAIAEFGGQPVQPTARTA